MSDYQFVIESNVAGIPCKIGVLEYFPGSYDYNASSDVDYYGACDWEVLDRKGYAANWLVKKLTSEDESRISDEIAEYYQNSRRRRY